MCPFLGVFYLNLLLVIIKEIRNFRLPNKHAFSHFSWRRMQKDTVTMEVSNCPPSFLFNDLILRS